MTFTRIGMTGRLYEHKENGKIWCWLCVRGEISTGSMELSLMDALTDQKLCASFCILGQKPDLKSMEDEQCFIDRAGQILEQKHGERGILWMPDLSAAESCCVCMLSSDGSVMTMDRSFLLETGLELLVKGQSKVSISPEQDGLVIGTARQNTAVLSGRYAPAGTESIDLLYIDLSGTAAGMLTFTCRIPRTVLANGLHAGFQLVVPDQKEQSYLVQWYPFLAGKDGITDRFFCQVCPLHLKGTFDGAKNRPVMQSVFYFKEPDTMLDTWYLTPEGECVVLAPSALGKEAGRQPAGFVPAAGMPGGEKAVRQKPYIFSPIGDFVVCPGSGGMGQEIMCGLNGVEKLIFRKGDALRFKAGQAAFAPDFPLQETDPLGPPRDTDASLLVPVFTMSWASAAAYDAAKPPCYAAQPEQGRLFGKGDQNILLPREPGIRMPSPPEEVYVPMLPYGGTKAGGEAKMLDAQQVIELEKTIIFQVRKKMIDQSELRSEKNLRYACWENTKDRNAENRTETVVTPSGVLADIDADSGNWERIRLGQSKGKKGITPFGFVKPDRQLQQAFSSGQLCLVAADAKHFPKACFQNRLEIDGWEFTAEAGCKNHYGDYANVLIIKSCRGPLIDLMKNPSKWTMADVFCPNGELTVLSKWIVNYLEGQKGEELYENLHGLIRDENWNGVLVLKASVTALPDSLGGLMAGLDRERFFAHHILLGFCDMDAANMKQNGAGALSGLIDYKDSAYQEGMGEHAVFPGTRTYDYKVLRLVSQFEYSALKQFYSLSQLCMHKCFGSEVLSMEDDPDKYCALLLRGSYQDHGGFPVYRMDIVAENGPKASTFLLDNEILKQVRVTQARMASQKEQDQSESCRICMDGFLCFEKLAYEEENAGGTGFDLYSFGGEDSGLAFREMAVKMVQKNKENKDWEISFDISHICIDNGSSKARDKSLAKQFSLTADGLIQGEDKLPGELGYLPAACGVRLSSLERSKWYGLKLSLHMGGLGALASNAAIHAGCLLAWGTEGRKKSGMFGIKLPGTSGRKDFLNLENILKLSTGSINLVKDREKDAFLLIMTNIALKFLGIVNLPPEGSSCFYLFADPNAEGAESKKGLGWYAAYNREGKESSDV